MTDAIARLEGRARNVARAGVDALKQRDAVKVCHSGSVSLRGQDVEGILDR
jgi:hypothetical protein